MESARGTDTNHMLVCPSPMSTELADGSRTKGLFERAASALANSRASRVLVLLAALWMLNAFDLVLTVHAHEQGVLHEENPVASYLLKSGRGPITLYKAGLMLIASYPFVRFRSQRITEMGALVAVLLYIFVAFRWSNCYEFYAQEHLDGTLADLALRGVGG